MFYSGISQGTSAVVTGLGDITTARYKRLEQVRNIEKSHFEALPISEQKKFDCPTEVYPEPAEWDSDRIGVVATALAIAADFEDSKKGLESIKTAGHTTSYVYYQEARDFDLFILRPAVYPVEYATPEKAIRFHEFISTLLTSVYKKVNELKPGRQIVFAGAGDGGAMALILAWRIYLSHEKLYYCGNGSNSLNQVSVVTFDTWPIITSERMLNCPLGKHNFLNFKSPLATEKQHRGFESGGFVIDVNSRPNLEHTAHYPEDKVREYIKYPEEWGERMGQNMQDALKLARDAIGRHHAIIKHYSSNAVPAFQMGATEIVLRDHNWCSNELSKRLFDTLGIGPASEARGVFVSCHVMKDNKERSRKSTRRIICNLVSTELQTSISFSEFDLQIIKNSELEYVKQKNRQGDDELRPKQNKWSKCMQEMFHLTTDLREFNPENDGRVLKIDFTPEMVPSQCYFVNRTTSRALRTAYTTNRELFYLIFSKAIHRVKPVTCEGQLKPPVISEKEKGNSERWLEMLRNFWGELMSTMSHDKSLEKDNLEQTANYKIKMMSWPPEYSFPGAFHKMKDLVNTCLAKGSSKDMIDCTRRDSLFAGINTDQKKNQCPLACKNEPQTTAGCERILPCGNGFFVAMRGDGILGAMYSPSRVLFENATPCESKNGKTFYISITDNKPSRLSLQANQMFATFFVDPLHVHNLITRSGDYTPKTFGFKDEPELELKEESDLSVSNRSSETENEEEEEDLPHRIISLIDSQTHTTPTQTKSAGASETELLPNDLLPSEEDKVKTSEEEKETDTSLESSFKSNSATIGPDSSTSKNPLTSSNRPKRNRNKRKKNNN